MRFPKESEWDLPVEERKMKFYTDPGAYIPERATPILGLYIYICAVCHGVFMDRFIFRHILPHFFPLKWNHDSVYERIQSIRYQKGKLNVIKRQ